MNHYREVRALLARTFFNEVDLAGVIALSGLDPGIDRAMSA